MDIGFKDHISGERWVAERVHRDCDFLGVVKMEGYWYIINIVSGAPLFRVGMVNKQDALTLGLALHNWFSEYFFIWTAKDWGTSIDLPGLLRYTIPQGLAIYAAIERFKQYEVANDLCEFSGLI